MNCFTAAKVMSSGMATPLHKSSRASAGKELAGIAIESWVVPFEAAATAAACSTAMNLPGPLPLIGEAVMPSPCLSMAGGAVAGLIRPEEMLARDPRRDAKEASIREQT